MRTMPLILAVSICTIAKAQEFPSPKPGKAHELFAKDAGTWDAEVHMFLQGPEGPPTTYKGVEVNKSVSGDLFVQSAFTSQMGTREFEGHGLMGFDPATNEYITMWVDNFNEAPTLFRGKFDETTNTLTATGTVSDGHGGEVLLKQVTTWNGESEKRFENHLVIEAAGQQQELKLMEITLKKRP